MAAVRDLRKGGLALSAPEMIRHITFFPVIDLSKCKRCLECESACLAGVIKFPRGKGAREEAPSVDKSLCHNCRRCVQTCPENAIKIDARFQGSGNTFAQARR